ncbi:MAG: DUF1549 domain-containing protein, partial [Planctomycetota bacterium]
MRLLSGFKSLFALSYAWLWLSGVLFAEEKIDFNRQIRPILNAHCISCHGPDEADRQAGLRLDNFEGATEYAVVPGDVEDSEAFQRIVTDDEDIRMPPAEHGEPLNEKEIELLRNWISQGAHYQKHWAFAAIKSPQEPKLMAQLGGNSPIPRIQNSIDRFILKRVFDSGLSQNQPSEAKELVRRVALDLTGLPPQAHDKSIQTAIDRFLQSEDQESFGQLVDQLLASSAYAEHWASVWLDLARYADTCGYSGDETRDIWPWRDWLIKALQSEKSYKQISIEMLAGDMLPDATTDQVLATAFHRNTLSNNEGGTNDEEFRTIAIKDRLSTTLNAWMGLTVRCAECHTHKYDPISQKEYYQLLDYFNQSVDSDHRDERPKLEVRQSRDPAELKRFDDQIVALKTKIANEPRVWDVLKPTTMTSREGTKFRLLADDSILAHGPLPNKEQYSFSFEIEPGSSVEAVKLEAIPHAAHNGNVGRAPEGAFILAQIRFEPEVEIDSAAEAQFAMPWKSATASFHQINREPTLAIRPEIESGKPQGWAVNHPQTGYRVHQEAIFELESPFVASKESNSFTIHLVFDSPWNRLNMGCVRLSMTSVKDAVGKYDKKQLDQINRDLAQLIEQRDAPIRVPIMKERDNRRDTYVMLRGNFQSKGEQVSAQLPEAFAGDKEFAKDRLGLAEWIFDESNPLTARVAVNRYWARLMGTGIVETEEDFGTQ